MNAGLRLVLMVVLGFRQHVSVRLKHECFTLTVPTAVKPGNPGPHSVYVAWGKSASSNKGLAGYMAFAEPVGGKPDAPTQNCTANVDEMGCTIRSLQPTTNYSVSAASFTRGRARVETFILGDLSEPTFIFTGEHAFFPLCC